MTFIKALFVQKLSKTIVHNQEGLVTNHSLRTVLVIFYCYMLQNKQSYIDTYYAVTRCVFWKLYYLQVDKERSYKN